jgi:acyl-CoA dehydrogenase
MNDLDQMLNDSAVRLFADLFPREEHEKNERGEWLAKAWQTLAETGLSAAASMEAEDSPRGLPLASLGLLARQAGGFNVPLPLVETYLAQRALLRAGIEFAEDAPLSLSTFCEGEPLMAQPCAGGYAVTGSARRVPWGRHLAGVVVAIQSGKETGVALLPPAKRFEHKTNFAGEPRDALLYDGEVVPTGCVALGGQAASAQEQWVEEGALLRGAQITGALRRVLETTVQYATERVQFGRPIGKFQAIQHQIAEMAAQVASATMAVDSALMAQSTGRASILAALAKIRASEAATLACEIAHQVHGAMGFTHEHHLHLSTRRLMSWRDEFGSDAHWSAWAGEQLAGLDGESLWLFITDPLGSELSNALEA